MPMPPAVIYWTLLLTKAILRCFDFVYSKLSGHSLFHGPLREYELSQVDYESSAQLVDIMWSGNYTYALSYHLDNFLYRHKAYVSPEYVLRNDNVTLYGFTRTHAFFCVTEKNVDVYDTRSDPFVFISQNLKSRRLVLVPHSSLHRLAESIGDPDDRNVSICAMTARCGSTLLCQMLARVPNTRVMSEPWAIVALHELYNLGLMSKEQHRDLLRSGLRLMCKKEQGHQVDNIVIKLPQMCCPQFEIMAELFPKFKLFFNTRHPKPSLLSFLKVTRHVETLLFKLLPVGWQIWMRFLPMPYEENYRKIHLRWWTFFHTISHELTMSLSFAACMACYLPKKHLYAAVVLYEDLNDQPERVLTDLFPKLNFSLEHVGVAMEALQHDSQNEIFGKRGADTSRAGLKTTTQEEWRKVDKVFEEFRVPITMGMDLEAYRSLIYADGQTLNSNGRLTTKR